VLRKFVCAHTFERATLCASAALQMLSQPAADEKGKKFFSSQRENWQLQSRPLDEHHHSRDSRLQAIDSFHMPHIKYEFQLQLGLPFDRPRSKHLRLWWRSEFCGHSLK